MHVISAIPWEGGRGSTPFHGDFKGDLIENLSGQEGEMREVCFLMSYSSEKYKGFCKTRSHVAVVVNEGH